MSANAFTSGASWSWPEEEQIPVTLAEQPSVSHTSGEWITDDEEELLPQKPSRPHQETSQPQSPPRNQRHYPPRTCRICLEVVPPTYETPPGGLSGMLSPAPQVTYISQDPESGRLIRPCKCKGSQKYVHEGCLQAWRHADPAYGRRNFWECPTCKFRYRLERMRWSSWITSTLAQIVLTLLILFTTIFILGFVADPIINLYVDPVGTLTTNPFSTKVDVVMPRLEEEEPTWTEHILKGLASLGLLGFIKVIFAMSPWQWYNLRNTGILGGGGGRNGRAGTGRDRLESVSWWLVTVGVITFLFVSYRVYNGAKTITDETP
jgi:RING-variant domain